MMKFTVVGNIHKRRSVSITWEDGKLSGDEGAIRMLRQLAKEKEGELVGPVGIYTETKHLEEGLSTLFLLKDVYDAIAKIEGDIPEAPPLPDGAIG